MYFSASSPLQPFPLFLAPPQYSFFLPITLLASLWLPSPQQQRGWQLSRNHSGSPYYRNEFLLGLPGPGWEIIGDTWVEFWDDEGVEFWDDEVWGGMQSQQVASLQRLYPPMDHLQGKYSLSSGE